MTFKDLQDMALEELGYDKSQASSTPRTRMKSRINTWQRRLLTRSPFKRLLREAYSYTFASVAAQTTYGLPIVGGRINQIYETTNDRQLGQRTMDWVRWADPGLSGSGTPEVWAPKGWFPVHTQPSDASAITMKSTAAGDTTQKMYIEYLNASGQILGTNVTLNGTVDTTLVASGVVEITELYLDGAAAGTVTVYEDDDTGTALAVLPIGTTSVRHLHIQLWPTPASAITYNVDLTRQIVDLANDNEVPLLHEDFHDVLALGAMADEWLLKDDARYQVAVQKLEDRLGDLTDFVWNLAEYKPGPGYRDHSRSRLGPWFPRHS